MGHKGIVKAKATNNTHKDLVKPLLSPWEEHHDRNLPYLVRWGPLVE